MELSYPTVQAESRRVNESKSIASKELFYVKLIALFYKSSRVPLLFELKSNSSRSFEYKFMGLLPIDFGVFGLFLKAADGSFAKCLTITVDDNIYPVFVARIGYNIIGVKVAFHDLEQDLGRPYRIPVEYLKDTEYDPSSPSNLDYYDINRVLFDAKKGRLIKEQIDILRTEIGSELRKGNYDIVLDYSKYLEGRMSDVDQKRIEIARKRLKT